MLRMGEGITLDASSAPSANDRMTHDSALWAVGLMSGTSLDGIDVALIRTDGERVLESGPAETYAYDEAFRQRLRRHLGGKGSAASIAATEAELTERHARAVDRRGKRQGAKGRAGCRIERALIGPADRRAGGRDDDGIAGGQ